MCDLSLEISEVLKLFSGYEINHFLPRNYASVIQIQ